MVPDSDEELVRRIRSGEEELFAELVDRHERAVFGLIYRQVGNFAVSQDLAQEVLVRAFRGLKTFRAESSFKTWLTRIALNVTTNYFNSAGYRRTRAQVEFQPERHDRPAEPYDFAAEQRLAELRRAIGRLKEKYRSVIALCVLEKRSYQEAAEILGVATGTIGSRLNTALALLHRELTESS